MKKSIRVALVTLLSAALIMVFCGFTAMPTAPGSSEAGYYMYQSSPNEDGIAKMLMKNGTISPDATPEQVQKAVQDYAHKKAMTALSKQQVKQELLQKTSAATKNLAISNLVNNYKNGVDTMGESQVAPVDEQSYTGQVRTAKLLVLLAQFGNDTFGAGPLSNQIPKPDKKDNSTFWVNNFSKDHFQNMLFKQGGYDAINQNGALHLDSMRDYYLQQSNGSYTVSGDVYGWFTLPHSETYYGDDSDTGTDNKLPGTPQDLVTDLLSIAAAQVDLTQYDIEDPYDIDEDGNIDEPDGIIDHLVIVHAGIDQSGGGGLQGDNAIWAHSSSVWDEIPVTNPTVDYWNGNMIAYNYVIQGENCGIGTFCHEYGHDLGLPDEYDTNYTASGEPVGFWSIMSSGSWLGQPLDIKPCSMSPWGRWQLGQIWGGKWIQPTEIESSDITTAGKTYKLDQSISSGTNDQALKINLPMQTVSMATAPFEGSSMWYSGRGDEMDNTLTTSVTLPQAANISLNYMAWYKIELGWDFAFVQASTDDGATWTSLTSSRMTSAHDSQAEAGIVENLPGYTGESGGWVSDQLNLTPYAGKTIKLRFRYMTDAATSYDGFFLDKLSITADGSPILTDNCNDAGNWIADGWTLNNGTQQKGHYYVVEWRNFQKTDATLNNVYSFFAKTDYTVSYFAYQPGMLVWYRNLAFSDNWVGDHPGYAFLGVVDSHPEAISSGSKNVARTRVQIYDAPFGLRSISPQMINLFGHSLKLGPTTANPVFDDSKSYWTALQPYAGLKLTSYGVKIQVTGASNDYTVGQVKVFK
jgi:immune inhibitor A